MGHYGCTVMMMMMMMHIQTTGTAKEDIQTTDQRGHKGGRGHCGYGPRSPGVVEED